MFRLIVTIINLMVFMMCMLDNKQGNIWTTNGKGRPSRLFFFSPKPKIIMQIFHGRSQLRMNNRGIDLVDELLVAHYL